MNTPERVRRVIEAGWGYLVIEPDESAQARLIARRYGRCAGTTTVRFGRKDPEELWLCTSPKGHTWDHFDPHRPEVLPSLEAGL